jgi:hemin uptake protein HemP
MVVTQGIAVNRFTLLMRMVIIRYMQDSSPPKPESPIASNADQAQPRTITSRMLFEGAREIFIDHDGRLYRMRITQNGKLLLTT